MRNRTVKSIEELKTQINKESNSIKYQSLFAVIATISGTIIIPDRVFAISFSIFGLIWITFYYLYKMKIEVLAQKIAKILGAVESDPTLQEIANEIFINSNAKSRDEKLAEVLREISHRKNDTLNPIYENKTTLQRINISDFMFKINDLTSLLVNGEEDLKELKWFDLNKKMRENDLSSLPVLHKETNKLIAVISQSILEKYLADFKRNRNSPPYIKIPRRLTLEELFQGDWNTFIGDASLYSFLPVNASIYDFNLISNNIQSDAIFITQTGKKDEKIEGIVTSDLVLTKIPHHGTEKNEP